MKLDIGIVRKEGGEKEAKLGRGSRSEEPRTTKIRCRMCHRPCKCRAPIPHVPLAFSKSGSTR